MRCYIPYAPDELTRVADVSQWLDRNGLLLSLRKVPWKEFPYTPEVTLRLGYQSRAICMKYSVTENYVRARFTLPNEPVYKDSCVEFFVSPSNDGLYYNFEFNAIGNCLAAVGIKGNRTYFNEDLISNIDVLPSLGRIPFEEKQGKQNWNLAIRIPLDVFWKHPMESLASRTFRANFYKCGDELTQPHYLSWGKIVAPEPDFHLPDFFGEIIFK